VWYTNSATCALARALPLPLLAQSTFFRTQLLTRAALRCAVVPLCQCLSSFRARQHERVPIAPPLVAVQLPSGGESGAGGRSRSHRIGGLPLAFAVAAWLFGRTHGRPRPSSPRRPVKSASARPSVYCKQRRTGRASFFPVSTRVAEAVHIHKQLSMLPLLLLLLLPGSNLLFSSSKRTHSSPCYPASSACMAGQPDRRSAALHIQCVMPRAAFMSVPVVG
jgi:hypothetical protein